MKQKKPRRSETIRRWQRKRTREWRQLWYAQGYAYKKVDGHWGWIKKGPRPVRPIKARIHSKDRAEIERLRRRIMEARTK